LQELTISLGIKNHGQEKINQHNRETEHLPPHSGGAHQITKHTKMNETPKKKNQTKKKKKKPNKTKQIRTIITENKRKFVRISHCQISEEGMRRPFPDDRMPSEVPRKSLPSKAFVSQRRCASAKAASQPASQPASAHHTSKLQKQSYAVCAQGQGSFFTKKKGKKNSQVKKAIQ
jgi:hypothetical protein